MAKSKDASASEAKKYTKAELQAFLKDVESQVSEHNLPSIHTMLALDHMLRVSNTRDVLDEDLKSHAREIWAKVKASGLHLSDPPILFGYPPLPTDDEEVGDGAEA